MGTVLGFIRFPPWLKPEIIPGLPVRWYGLMYLVAFFVAYQLVRIQVREKGLAVQRDYVLNLFFWAIVGLLVGARLAAVTIYDPSGYYLRHPLEIILPVRLSGGRVRLTGIAGMSYHGGLAGTIVACIIYLKAKKFSILEWGDMIVTGSALGYTFGRLGNFINGELYGRITTLPWGMVFPLAPSFPAKERWVQEVAGRVGIVIAGQEMVNLPRHPSQLYEAFFEGIVLWAILWFGFRKRKSFRGQLIAIYVMGYGFFRFLIEYVREPDADLGFPIQFVALDNPQIQFSPFNLTTGQILNLIMILVGVLCYLIFRHRDRLERQRLEKSPPIPHVSWRKLRKRLR
jgi:phosphatidylglycerol:prolipoprotein diacylglycerol transferase